MDLIYFRISKISYCTLKFIHKGEKLMKKILGIDIGGVIIERQKNEKTLEFPAVPDAIKSIRLLGKVFKDNIIIVSAIKDYSMGQDISNWLYQNNFFYRTGIPDNPLHLYFCLERQKKADICKEFKVTHFIDDRMEVLSALVDLVPNLYLLNQDPEEIKSYADYLPKVHLVNSWREITELIYK